MDCFTWIRIGKLRRRIRVDDGYRNDGTSVLDVWKKKKKKGTDATDGRWQH